MRWLTSLFLGLALAACALAQSQSQSQSATWAVVRLPSHGASATIISTAPGKTVLLGCAHAFQGKARTLPITVDVPTPTPATGQRKASTRLLDLDYALDLTLVELGDGPLPWVTPVAPAGHRPGRLVSAGYDGMHWPATVAGATLLNLHGHGISYTRERPVPGRSGGGLIDMDAGLLVGVCQGYEVTAGGRGMYVSHAAILAFLTRGSGRPPAVKEERQFAPQLQPCPT